MISQFKLGARFNVSSAFTGQKKEISNRYQRGDESERFISGAAKENQK